MLPNRIRALREAAGLSVEELAERVGTTHGQISRLETGVRRLNLDWMQKIAEALGCAPADLISMAAALETTDDVEPIADAGLASIFSRIARRGLRVYRVTGTSVAHSGIRPGATIVIDDQREAIAQARTGDVVLVRTGEADALVLRVFVAPGLLTTNRDGANIAVLLSDPYVSQEIVGVVIQDDADAESGQSLT